MDFFMISQFIRVPEDLLTCSALVFESKVHHHVLITPTVTLKVVTTVSTVKSLAWMLVDNMLVQFFVFAKFFRAPVTRVGFWSFLSFGQSNSGDRNYTLSSSNGFCN